MSLLAHSIFGAPRFEVKKKELDNQIQHEISEAKRIQRDVGCTWAEALRLASGRRGIPGYD